MDNQVDNIEHLDTLKKNTNEEQVLCPLDNNNDSENNDVSLNNTQNPEVVNCLALTLKKDYSLSIVKNVVNKTFRSFWKIATSIFALNLLKFFL